MTKINDCYNNLVLNKVNSLEFLNIASAFFLLQAIALRLIVKLLNTPEVSAILIGRFILGVMLAIMIVITALWMKGKKSNKVNVVQLVCAFVFLLFPSRCVIDSALDKNPMIIMPILIVIFAMAVIVTNIAYMNVKRKIFKTTKNTV